MARAANLAKRIRAHRANATHFGRLGRRRHLRAAVLARRSLVAKQKGHHKRAVVLLKRALRLKALAARAKLRAKLSRARVAAIRRLRSRRVRRPK
jgi:hypothetical protein